MKKDVWLTIRSRQQFEGCDEERVNLETAATLYERGGKYYIAYEESELTGLEGTKTTVKLDGKTVTSHVSNTVGENGGRLVIDYTVEVDNSLMGEHHFEMVVS